MPDRQISARILVMMRRSSTGRIPRIIGHFAFAAVFIGIVLLGIFTVKALYSPSKRTAGVEAKAPPTANVKVTNGTTFEIYIRFYSGDGGFWPATDRAFLIKPGDTFDMLLSGTDGEPVHYQAWAKDFPNVEWRNEDGPDGGLRPFAVCGQLGVSHATLVFKN